MRKKYRPKTKQDLRKLILNEEIELGNFDKIGDYKYIYCPVCGLEILV